MFPTSWAKPGGGGVAGLLCRLFLQKPGKQPGPRLQGPTVLLLPAAREPNQPSSASFHYPHQADNWALDRCLQTRAGQQGGRSRNCRSPPSSLSSRTFTSPTTQRAGPTCHTSFLPPPGTCSLSPPWRPDLGHTPEKAVAAPSASPSGRRSAGHLALLVSVTPYYPTKGGSDASFTDRKPASGGGGTHPRSPSQ